MCWLSCPSSDDRLKASQHGKDMTHPTSPAERCSIFRPYRTSHLLTSHCNTTHPMRGFPRSTTTAEPFGPRQRLGIEGHVSKRAIAWVLKPEHKKNQPCPPQQANHINNSLFQLCALQPFCWASPNSALPLLKSGKSPPTPANDATGNNSAYTNPFSSPPTIASAVSSRIMCRLLQSSSRSLRTTPTLGFLACTPAPMMIPASTIRKEPGATHVRPLMGNT